MTGGVFTNVDTCNAILFSGCYFFTCSSYAITFEKGSNFSVKDSVIWNCPNGIIVRVNGCDIDVLTRLPVTNGVLVQNAAGNNQIRGNFHTSGIDVSTTTSVKTNKIDILTDKTNVVASAASIKLIHGHTLFSVTGTTNITSIDTTDAFIGRMVTLVFSGVLTFTDGSNLSLAGNFVTSAGDTITLVYNGTTWSEVSRSVN